MLYIKPLPNALCPMETCLTLSQFTAKIKQKHLELNTTIIFLPGNYSLEAEIFVTDLCHFSVFSNSSIIICQRDASFKFDNISYLWIRGLKFVGCGNNSAKSVEQFRLENSIFLGQKESETALEVIETSIKIVNSSFLFNTVGTFRGPIGVLKYSNWADGPLVYAYVGGAIIANQSNVTIKKSTFLGNRAEIGGAIFATQSSSIMMINSMFMENSVADYFGMHCYGGVLYSENGLFVATGCEFSDNTATYGTVITAFNCTINVTSSKFYNNIAKEQGGVVWIQTGSSLTISDSEIANNTAQRKGGGIIHMTDSSSVMINVCQVYNNFAMKSGSVIDAYQPHSLAIYGSSLWNNTAQDGGVIAILNDGTADKSRNGIVVAQCGDNNKKVHPSVNFDKHQCNNSVSDVQEGVSNMQREVSTISIFDSVFNSNVAHQTGGVFDIEYTSNMTVKVSTFRNNVAYYGSGGVFEVERISLSIQDVEFINNQAGVGGVIRAFQSNIFFRGMCNLTKNAGVTGGVIYAVKSIFTATDTIITIENNTAYYTGGGFYLYRSEVHCQHNSTLKLLGNVALRRGGGIHAINSFILIISNGDPDTESSIHFTRNTAKFGGGIYLEVSSELYILKVSKHTTYNLYFIANSAAYGGAIFVEDRTNFKTCGKLKHYEDGTNCFLQIMAQQEITDFHDLVSLVFIQNSAQQFGSILFGGLLDRCTVSNVAKYSILPNPDSNRYIDGVSYFRNVSYIINDSWIHAISSSAVRVCFCNPNGQPECSFLPPSPIRVKKGEKFNLSLTTVDQINHTVENALILAYFLHEGSALGEGQMSRTTSDGCSNLTFSVRSSYPSERLYLYAAGPCGMAGKSQRILTIMFLKCTCPVGFQPKQEEENTNCECVCDSQLYPYITDPNCNPQTGTLLRLSGNFWITYLKNVDKSSGYKYLIYPYCPFDYCLPPSSNIHINLNLTNGADVQCANNRSGILCGKCQPGLSLSLGSSRCISCSNAWHKDAAAILIAAFLSGIALVTFILVLNLTVAVGTLNGLIFYANIIDANRNSFFSSSEMKSLSVFISWLNLEVGFDTCFYEGMDTYWKTWLQLAFPTYIILLVVIVIVVSEHSMRFSRVIAKRNPVATLATLILFSYTRLLFTTITSLSFASVYYPDGSHRTLWLPDASVEYLSVKHIALLILSIFILLLSIAYTFLLFFWQWLLHHQDKIVLKWINYQRLCHFIEPYHAPYIFKHRYWTGLLLFARVALYLVFALNVSGDPGVNLLAIILITGNLIFLKGFIGKIYKNWVVEIVEMICYLNIALFSATILYTREAERSHTFTAYISGSITFALFLVVLIYHVFTEMLLKLWKNCLLYTSPSPRDATLSRMPSSA